MFIEFDYKSLVLGTHTQTSQLKKHKQTNEMKLMHAYIINNVVKLVYVFFFINLLWLNACKCFTYLIMV
jgi:hypothetical protein